MSEHYCTMRDPDYIIMLAPTIVNNPSTVFYSEINFEAMNAIRNAEHSYVNLLKTNNYCKISRFYRFKRLFCCFK